MPLDLGAARPPLVLPNEWRPRPYQVPPWRYMAQGGKRAVLVWHRRAGKDSFAVNWTACAAHQRIGNYWHMLPEAKQARKAIWEAIDRQGRRVIDQAFPKELRKGQSDQEMIIRLKCGSTWQVVGSDNFDSLVGSNPVGIVFSEYSISDPRAWNFLRPILRENGGWAIFIYTPRGRNHGKVLFDVATRQEDWHAQLLTVDDTHVLTEADIQAERDEGMSEDMIRQEYYCSFDAALVGAYYGNLMVAAEDGKRIGKVPHEPSLPVWTAWDLGMDDCTAIWFAQQVGREVRIIDYYENAGEGLEHYAKVLDKKPYKYAYHILPHDAQVRELGSGKSRTETLHSLGIFHQKQIVLRPIAVEDGIQAVRNLIPRCWFNEATTERGLECLRQYSREYDEKLKTFKTRPLHNWASHGADAFRYLATGMRPDDGGWGEQRQPSTKWVV